MKWKRFLAGVGTLCLGLSLFLPLQVRAQENTGSTAIKTTVPDAHIVLLDIGEHGSVLINDKTYTAKDEQVKVARLAEQTYNIQPDEGWQIEQVKYGQEGVQETVKVSKGAFTAPAICSDDNKLTVTFRKNSANGGTDTEDTDTPDKGGQTSPQTGTGVKTGDTVNFILWLSLLGGSGAAVLILRRKMRIAD